MTPPILVLAIGNESRGDDALAPLLLHQLAAHTNNARVEWLLDFQLQIEHAADLAGRELALFVDAGMDTPAPFSFHRAQPGSGRTLFSHALAPEAVLATYAQVYRSPPPPAFTLCIRGEQFELGSPLTPQAAWHLELAENFLLKLLHEPELAAWEALRCPLGPRAAEEPAV